MNRKIFVLSAILLCAGFFALSAQASGAVEAETAVEEQAPMGAMSENAELSGKALPFVGLAEGICLWGFLVGLLIIVL